jgi:hypothetical protein
MIEVLKQALEALYPISHNSTDDYRGQADKAITSLRQAIAELESQEPVSTLWQHGETGRFRVTTPDSITDCDARWFKVGDLYLHPPQRTEQEPVAWTSDDMAYRPNGLPQDFVKHEVESVYDWSDWVCPNPEQYFMKCCDCGLVHEMQFKVAKYKLGNECEFVEDTNLQAVFKARRTHPPQRTWVGLTNGEIHNAYIEAANQTLRPQDERIVFAFARALEAKLKEKTNA